jgi:hypothetical protein
MFMNRLLMLVLMAGTAWAQTGLSAFSTEGHVSSAPELQPVTPATSTGKDTSNGLPDLLPQPKGKATLIGGTILKVDRVRDQMTLNVFGGGKTKILFDTRTHIYRDGVLTSAADLQNGARVYVDTVLAGVDIFAQTIRLRTQYAAGQGSGQVASYDARAGVLVLNDTISPRQLKLRILPTTEVSREGQTASAGDLREGTLVSVTFLSDGNREPAAHTIAILAAPGNTYVFVGRVIHLDLHLGLVVMVDPRDQKTYEISFDPNFTGISDNLREGATVEATTRFDGAHYTASAIKIDSKPN